MGRLFPFIQTSSLPHSPFRGAAFAVRLVLVLAVAGLAVSCKGRAVKPSAETTAGLQSVSAAPDEPTPPLGPTLERPPGERGAIEPPTPPTPRPPEPDARDQQERARLQERLGFPLYPGGRRIPSLSRESATELRLVLTTEDAPERVVRFYEEKTGKLARLTELSDGDIHDIILGNESRVEGGAIPVHGIQVRPTPKWHLRDGVVGRTSIILFRRQP